MRLFRILLICTLAASLPLAASAAQTPPSLGHRTIPSPPRFNHAPTFSSGTTLTVEGHGPIAVLNWSASTCGVGCSSGTVATRFGMQPIHPTSFTLTVPFDKTSQFLQDDADANPIDGMVVLNTPDETFTLKRARVSSFSLSGSGNQETAQFTLETASANERTQGGFASASPCPTVAVVSPLICFPQLDAIGVDSWNLNAAASSSSAPSQLTFSASLGKQVVKFQFWAQMGTKLNRVTLLTVGTKYVFTRVSISSVQVQGSGGAEGEATITLNFQKSTSYTK